MTPTIFCLNCRKEMLTSCTACPHCGAVVGSVPAPALLADQAARDAQKAKRAANWRTAGGVAILLITVGPPVVGFVAVVGLVVVFVRACTPTPESEARREIERRAHIDAIEAIRPTIEQGGVSLRYNPQYPSVLYLRASGPVDTYDAERLARVTVDKLPGVAVVVEDEVGVERGRAGFGPGR